MLGKETQELPTEIAELTAPLPAQVEARYRRDLGIKLGAITNIAARGSQFVFQLLLMRWVLAYLGSERYGLWLTLTASVSILTFADLGIGNGIVNALSTARARGSYSALKATLSTGITILATIGVLLVAAFSASSAVGFDWTTMLLRRASITQESREALTLALLAFAMGLPLSLSQKIVAAIQKPHLASVAQFCSSVTSLAGVLLAVRLNMGLTGITLATVCIPIVQSALLWIILHLIEGPWVTPRVLSFDTVIAARLLGQGGFFVLLQATSAGMLQAPIILLSRLGDPGEAGKYATILRVALVVPLIISTAVTPLWPAVADAKERADAIWIRRTVRRALTVTALSGLAGAIVFGLLSQPVVRYWLGPEMVPNPFTVGALSLFLIAHSLRWTTSMLLCGLGNIKRLVAFQGVPLLLASFSAALYASGGRPTGVAWSFALAEACICILQFAELLRRTPFALNAHEGLNPVNVEHARYQP